MSFDKGSTGDLVVWFATPELRVGTDPHTLAYDPANLAAPAITTNAAQTIAENTVIALQIAANHPGNWSRAGTDAALFSIDNFGIVSFTGTQNPPNGAFDYGDTHAPVYAFTATLTPYNPALTAASKAITLTITDVSDGFSDQMGAAYTANSDVPVANTSWTAATDYVAGPVQYTGGINGVKSISATGGAILAPQQGDTVEQRISFTPRTSSTSAGGVSVLALISTTYLGIADWAGTAITIRRNSTIIATFTVHKTIATSDALLLQVIHKSGVYTLECQQNGVTLPLASGSANVTADVTGAGTLAAVRRSGIVQRSAALTVSWVSKWNNVVAPPVTSLGYLKTLTWAGGATSYTATSGTDAKDIANRTPLSSISLGTISPVPTAGDFLADGDTIRG